MWPLLKWKGVGWLVLWPSSGRLPLCNACYLTHQLECVSRAGVRRPWGPQCHTLTASP